MVISGSVLFAALMLSCSDDPVEPGPAPSPYKGLAEREDVLINLERSVTEQNYKEYKRLHDPEFVFTFSDADHIGGPTPENWGRAHELAAVNNMCDPNYAGDHPVSSIEFSLQYTDDDWTEITAPDTLLYAGEQWSTKAVRYSVKVVSTSGWTFIGIDLDAVIVIRKAGGIWQIVEWRDSDTRSAVAARRSAENGAVEDVTWGAIKYNYEEDPGYQDLSARDDALINLELAYSSFNRAEYNRLLNPDLIFYFSEADIAQGLPYSQFDKEDEIIALTNMKDDTRQDRVLSINLDLHYPAGQWTVFDPDDPQYDGETWYQKTVIYNMTVQAEPNMTYVGTDMRAQFTVREVAGVGGARKWQIVRWRDDVMGAVLNADLAKNALVKETTWGAVKALYR